MTRKVLATLIPLFFLACTLAAGDARWVNGAFRWSGTGTLCTEVFPIFGDDFRIGYAAAQNGTLKITLVDATDETLGKRKPAAVVVDAKKLMHSERRLYSGRKAAYLVIEGGSRPWTVAIDQYLGSIEEWRLKEYVEETANAKLQKLGVWAEEGAQKMDFTPQEKPWRLTVTPQKDVEGTLRISVRTADQRLLLQGTANRANAPLQGWLHTTAPVIITVECPDGTPWNIEAEAR